MAKELPRVFKQTEQNPLDYECLLKDLIHAEKIHNKKNKGKKLNLEDMYQDVKVKKLIKEQLLLWIDGIVN